MTTIFKYLLQRVTKMHITQRSTVITDHIREARTAISSARLSVLFSLASQCSKILETIIKDCLTKYLEKNCIITDVQHGLRT